MILYRIQVSSGPSWSTEWHATQASAKKAFKLLVAEFPARPVDIYYDEVEIVTGKTDTGSGRDNVANALNHAGANREVWPGTLVEKVHLPVSNELEDLLS